MGTKRTYIILLVLTVTLTFTMSSCRIGSDSYKEPWEIDDSFVYCVVYNAMGGTINNSGERTTYYSGGSLIKEPNRRSGMLVEPVNGNKLVFGWYTSYINIGTEENPVYSFDEANRWDFTDDRINDENTDGNKTLTLYARWTDPPSVYFVDASETDNVLLKWEDVVVKKPLSRPTTTEKATIQKVSQGTPTTYSLLDYFFDKDCTVKVVWDTDTVEDIIYRQDKESIIYIYCKYIEGNYKRIRNASDLRNINEHDGKYILANDIYLGSVIWTPLCDKQPFSGVFIGNGYTISDFNIDAVNRESGVGLINAREKSFGLFSELSGAFFSGINLQNVTVTVNKTSNVPLCIGVFGGRAADTVFVNCGIDAYKVSSDGEVKTDLFLGTAAFADSTCTLTDNSFNEPDISNLDIKQTHLFKNTKQN
ncbi:MAG: hypothetical protein CVU97_00545 [Firmicutes bacterium HGW-Firmicutes-21]|nr:MAG: hypothetical protein CVU97_00545 [Firmicutes bacterium HGW-Firmicutes-21]